MALRCAEAGANVVIAAKTADPHPKLPGTIYSVAEECEKAGGRALPVQMELRNVEDIGAAVEKAATHFGGMDVLINNASAQTFTKTPDTTPKQFDLMFDVNVPCARYGGGGGWRLSPPQFRRTRGPDGAALHIAHVSSPFSDLPPRDPVALAAACGNPHLTHWITSSARASSVGRDVELECACGLQIDHHAAKSGPSTNSDGARMWSSVTARNASAYGVSGSTKRRPSQPPRRSPA
jgi:NAD(P)-dependent dehydrogenase (short-subunit alcohol dehydrogenase family)